MNRIKLFLGIFVTNAILFLSAPALANDEMSRPAIWKKVLSCDGGAAVVDVDVQDRGPYHTGLSRQIVIRDSAIVNFLKSKNWRIPLNTETNEIISRLYINIGNVTSRNDYMYVGFNNDEEGYKLTFTGIVNSYVDGDGHEHPRRQWEIANWYFQDCQEMEHY